jgi:hypothetical protein
MVMKQVVLKAYDNIVGTTRGERLVQSAISGFDRAIKKLDQATEVIAEHKRENDVELDRIKRQQEQLEAARQKSQKVAAKLRELVSE